jgi:twitching motility protein PilI
MSRQDSLKEFQEALAQRLRDAAQGDHESRLGVEAGPRRFLVRLDQSGEVLPVPELTPVPLAKPWFQGLANVRGKLVSVIDLAAFCGDALQARTPESRLVLLAERFGAHCALLVSRTGGLRAVSTLTQRTAGADGWMGAVFDDRDGQQWRELDLGALAATPEFLQAAL